MSEQPQLLSNDVELLNDIALLNDVTPINIIMSVNQLESCPEGPIIIKGRIHNIRNLKRNTFIVLRFKTVTIQCVAFKNIFGDMSITKESIILINGILQVANPPIKSCSITGSEIIISSIKVISASTHDLPFLISDADAGNVTLETKLSTPWLNFRTQEASKIARVKSHACHFFREYLINNNFIEIHTLKIIGAKSEGGSNVFGVKYFERDAYLAQSSQLYKQMAINGDYDRVFEIGPVFRAEPFTHNRHLCEFVSMDVEMTIDNDYYDIINRAKELLLYMVTKLNNLYPSENNPHVNKIPIISYPEAIKILRDQGVQIDDVADMSSNNEAILGWIIMEVSP